jgi:ABC-type amino acid transport system permease subunit
VRSTVWTLVIFVVVCVGLTALIAWLTETHWTGPRAAERDVRVIADPVGFILGTGIGLGQLAICVLGVLVITSEYSTGVIRASLLAVPRRIPVLAAKALGPRPADPPAAAPLPAGRSGKDMLDQETGAPPVIALPSDRLLKILA